MPLLASAIHSTIGEFQRQYIYKLYIETLPDGFDSLFASAASFQANVDVYNTKAVFPERKTEPIKIEWDGEYFEIPGVDAGKRDNVFEFFEDQAMWVYDFFKKLKDLTGNELNHASVVGSGSKFQIGVAQVSVDKDTITCYRKLKGCRVYGVEFDDIAKDAKGVSKLKIDIHWDQNEEDETKRGQPC